MPLNTALKLRPGLKMESRRREGREGDKEEGFKVGREGNFYI